MNEKAIKAFQLKRQGDYDGALAILNESLAEETSQEVRCELFGLRASFFEDLGRYEEATNDWLSALSLIPNASYARYVNELRLGSVYKKLSQLDNAANWYKKALATVCRTKGVSGGGALKGFLDIVGEGNLTDDERILCNDVVTKSWKLLRIDGEPDLTNLLKTSEEIIKAQGKPRPRD